MFHVVIVIVVVGVVVVVVVIICFLPLHVHAHTPTRNKNDPPCVPAHPNDRARYVDRKDDYYQCDITTTVGIVTVGIGDGWMRRAGPAPPSTLGHDLATVRGRRSGGRQSGGRPEDADKCEERVTGLSLVAGVVVPHLPVTLPVTHPHTQGTALHSLVVGAAAGLPRQQ